MSYPPPYRSGSKEWKTLRGLERSIERFGGINKGFHDNELIVEWPPNGEYKYAATSLPDCTSIELQLKYDLEP